ncbi:MAG TPA: peptide ABC transporter substrate-binding protein, partial [Phycisphaerae bacterium]|nr:peptide ABC transporter substrate-binding protein [Phycisphaerae bacterium]
RWSNGDPVTSADFVFAWQRILQPSTASEYVDMLFDLAGAKAYYNTLAVGKSTPFSTVGVTAPDQWTLVVHLSQPCSYFLGLTAFPPYFPLNRKAMQPFIQSSDDGPATYNPLWTHPPNLVSNGAYQLADWKFHQYLDMTPNQFYWDHENVRCERIRIASEDPTTAFLAYHSGLINVLSFVPPDFAHQLLEQQAQGRRDDIHYVSVFGTYFYYFNCRHKPLNDPRVREALDLVVDKQKIVQDVLELPDKPLNVLVPPNMIPGYQSPDGMSMNIVLAQQLLAQAGYPDGRGFPTLTLLINGENTIAPHARIAQAIQAMWKTELNININIEQMESSVFRQQTLKGNYDIASGDWYGDYIDPTTWLDLFRSENPNNISKFSDPAFDSLMLHSDAQADPSARMATLRSAEAILVDQEFPAMPLYQMSDGMMYDPQKIGGIDPNIRFLTLLKYMHWIDR